MRAAGPAALAAQATARARGLRRWFGPGEALRVDPVPRIFEAQEWQGLAAGLVQRARALEALVVDAYGERRAVRAGALPEEVLDSSLYLERDLVGAPEPPVTLGNVGFDVIRDPEGTLRVLEDNLLTPGHFAAPALREALPLHDHVGRRPEAVRGPLVAAMDAMLPRAAGRRAILTDDGGGFDVRWLAEQLALPIVTLDDVGVQDDRLVTLADGLPLDLVWQRTAEDRLHTNNGGSTRLGDLLRAPLRAGRLQVVNRIGCGVADDKRVSRHLDAVARELLGEELVLPCVPTLDLGDPDERAEALGAPREHVFKPRNGAGGRAIVFGRSASDAELALLGRRVGEEPGHWVAQRHVPLSTLPAVAGDRLEPRPVDLRVFALRTPEGFVVVPGGFCRFGAAPDSDLVNTSAGGGVKDVWVLPPED